MTVHKIDSAHVQLERVHATLEDYLSTKQSAENAAYESRKKHQETARWQSQAEEKLETLVRALTAFLGPDSRRLVEELGQCLLKSLPIQPLSRDEVDDMDMGMGPDDEGIDLDEAAKALPPDLDTHKANVRGGANESPR